MAAHSKTIGPIALETGVIPLANGSAKVCIGCPGRGGDVQDAGGVGGGTEVVVGVKLEVAGVGEQEEGVGGRIACTVSCSPAAYPSLSSNALEDFQSDLTILLESVLAHPSLCASNLIIVPGKKAWAVKLDAVVTAHKEVEYRAPTRHGATTTTQDDVGMDTGLDGGDDVRDGLRTKGVSNATDFELTDYWDEGEALSGRESWPVCVTLNVLSNTHFLDATLQEEASVPLRMYVMYAFPKGKPILQTFRLVGPETSTMDQIRDLIKRTETYARNAWAGLEAKLKDEEARRGIKAREKFYGKLR
ncbi:ribosomal protein S5 domain 2-like protein [Chiua virens]|nr:ribosomal protein S5 domain 2-like protein [Chiua virens]